MTTATTSVTSQESSSPAAKPQSNKLQKMLDLEHKRKMERIQGAPVIESQPSSPTTAQSPSHPSFQLHKEDPPTQTDPPSKSTEYRSTETPSLSIIVPSSPVNTSPNLDGQNTGDEPQTPPKQRSKTVSFLPDEKDDGDDNKSETSSICQSPIWEGYGQKKKDKKAEEKQRRKAREQAEKEAKKKPTAKLTKHPPSASRTHLMDKSTSTPALPEQDRARPASAHVEPAQATPQTKHRRRRSSSIASQIRAALTGQPSQETGDEKEVGFIGGLKLEKEREAAALKSGSSAAKPSSGARVDAPSSPQKAHSFGPGVSASASDPNILPRAMSDFPNSSTPLLRHKDSQHVQMRAPVVPGRMKTTADNHEAKRDLSQDEPSRGRRLEGYVKRHRRQSQDRAISGFNDENKVSAKSHYPPQANRQHYARAAEGTSDGSIDSEAQSRSASRGSISYGHSTESVDTQGNPPVELHADSAPKTTRGRTRSRELSIGSSKGFRDAIHGALKRVRSSSRGPGSSSGRPERQPADNTGHTAQNSRVSLVPQAQKKTESTLKVPDFAQPSSSSSSCCEDSLRLPSSTTTPDSRPQPDKELPPVVGEVGKRTARHVLVENDERVFRLSQRATLSSDSGTATPGSLISSREMKNDKDVTRDRQRHASKKFSWEALGQEEGQVNQDSDSYKTCESDESQTSPLSSPKMVPIRGAKKDREARNGHKARESKRDGSNGAAATVTRVPSLPKSHSSPNVTVDARHHKPKQDVILVAPPRPQVPGDTVNNPISSVSLPDALTATASPAGAVAQRPTDPSAYLQKARKAVPVASVPRPVRGGAGSGQLVAGAGWKEGDVEPLAKMFVECCGCKFFHDMPSRVYECMANPNAEVEDTKLGVSGAITTVVNCPWCKHGMTTRCCAGYAAVVYLKERLH